MIETFGVNHTFYENCIRSFAELLSIEVPNIIVYVDDIMEPTGECYQISDDEYMIVLKSQKEGHMLHALAHEMVHVKQFLQDNLASHFCTNIPYMERWWEIEAYAKEKDLIADLIEKVRSGVINKGNNTI